VQQVGYLRADGQGWRGFERAGSSGFRITTVRVLRARRRRPSPLGATDQVAAANVRWLAGYRHPRRDVPEVTGVLRQVFATPIPLHAGVERHKLDEVLADVRSS
jgi:hypothetical protein